MLSVQLWRMPDIICLASAHRIDTHLPARYIRLFNLSPRIDTHLPALVFLCLFNLSPRIDTHLPAIYYTFVCCCAEIHYLDSCRDSESSYSYGVGSGMGGGYVWEARVRKYAQRLETLGSENS